MREFPPHTLVLMQLAAPEAFKLSEEAVSGAAPPITELPFANILTHLAKADVANAKANLELQTVEAERSNAMARAF